MDEHKHDSLDFLPLPDVDSQTQTQIPPKPTEVRVLTDDERSSIAHIFAENRASMPDPSSSFILGAVDGDGRVLGFLTVQLAIHAEPMYIEPGHEGLFGSIVSTTEAEIYRRVGPHPVFLFAPAGRVARLAQVSGMQIEPWVVLSKVVGPPDGENIPIRKEGVDLDQNPDPVEEQSKGKPN